MPRDSRYKRKLTVNKETNTRDKLTCILKGAEKYVEGWELIDSHGAGTFVCPLNTSIIIMINISESILA